MSDTRPQHFAPGTYVGEHFTVEGLVRLTEGRMFYLANDTRPDRVTRRCWTCGHEANKAAATACASCGGSLGPRKFLLSSRWQGDGLDRFAKVSRLGWQHPGLLQPVMTAWHDEQLVAAYPYADEGLLVDEASPLANERIFDLAQRIAGTVAWVHRQGVRLGPILPAQVLLGADGRARLFDFDVAAIHEGPADPGELAAEVASVGEMLRRFVNVEAESLTQFLETVARGRYPDPKAFGRAVEQRFDVFAGIRYAPRVAAFTDVGLMRQLNEDNWGWRKLSNRATMYLVADGMGGHDGGEVASALAIQTASHVAREEEMRSPPANEEYKLLVDKSFQAANNTIKDHADAKGNDMGTTMVGVVLLDDNTGYLGNVGDSRAYVLRRHSLHQLTKDHSLVAKMVERGKITAEEARTHPHSNILLRTVGTERDIDIDVFRVKFEPGDRVLLCSDGLWGEVEDRDIESILNTYDDPRIAARELVRAAHHGGGKDNVTLILVGIA